MCRKRNKQKNEQKMTSKSPLRKKNDPFVKILARKYSLTARYIRYVIAGDRRHEGILADYMDLRAGLKKLVDRVEKQEPFTLQMPKTPKQK